MNEINSAPEESYRPRWLAPRLRSALDLNPVVVLTGARQVGKSTLLRNEEPFSSWRYFTLDDYDVLDRARSDPQSLWAGTEGVVFDEVQKAPELLSAIKIAVDGDAGIRFALSGSANLLLMKHVTETLAGRAAYVDLGPMTLGEVGRRPAPTLLAELLAGRVPDERSLTAEDPLPYMTRGLMPRLISASTEQGAEWWQGYVATYLERGLRQLSQVASLTDYRRVMEMLALRQGQLLNQSEVARDAKVTQPTTHRYINLLEASALLSLLPSYGANRTTRIIKSPKPYWFDCGAASFLSGHYSTESLGSSREAGGSFEGLVFQHLSALASLASPAARIHFWRTTTNAEVDFVVEHGRSLLAIECKLAATAKYSHAESLTRFMTAYPETAMGVVVYAGSEIKQLAEKVVAIPWTVIAGR